MAGLVLAPAAFKSQPGMSVFGNGRLGLTSATACVISYRQQNEFVEKQMLNFLKVNTSLNAYLDRIDALERLPWRQFVLVPE